MTLFDWAVDQLERASFKYQHESIDTAERIFSKQRIHGTFNLRRAVDYMDYNVVTPAARRYAMQFSTLEDIWRTWFPDILRKQVAENIINNLSF